MGSTRDETLLPATCFSAPSSTQRHAVQEESENEGIRHDAEVGVNISERAAELGDEETDTNNLHYLTLVAEARETVEGHQALSQQSMSGMFWPTCNWSRPPCLQLHRGRKTHAVTARPLS